MSGKKIPEEMSLYLANLINDKVERWVDKYLSEHTDEILATISSQVDGHFSELSKEKLHCAFEKAIIEIIHNSGDQVLNILIKKLETEIQSKLRREHK